MTAGYVVLWLTGPNGAMGMRASRGNYLERGGSVWGVLFNPGRGGATLFPTLKQAKGAVKRSVAFWREYDGQRDNSHYRIVRVRA